MSVFTSTPEYADDVLMSRSSKKNMLNPESPARRIMRRVAESYRGLSDSRDQQALMVRQYVGSHYDHSGSRSPIPVNWAELFVNTVSQQLSPLRPQVKVRMPYSQEKSAAKLFEAAINMVLDHINLSDTLYRAAVSSMFSMAVVKIGIETPSTRNRNNDIRNVPFVDLIHFSDWVHDVSASCWEEMDFMGNRYPMHRDDIVNNKEFDFRVRALAGVRGGYGSGAYDNRERESISGYSEALSDSDRVFLWDIYIPREKKVITVYDSDFESPPLREITWDGPDIGPYIAFMPQIVPGHVLPLPLLANLLDMHMLANSLYNKMGRQATSEKTLVTVNPGMESDGYSVRDAPDRGVVTVSNTQAIDTLSFPGVTSSTFAYALHAGEVFSRMAGNLDVLAGLSAPQATFGQTQLLAQGASRRVAFWQKKFKLFISNIVRQVAWWMWNSADIQVPASLKIGNTDYDFSFTWPKRKSRLTGEKIDVRVLPFEQMQFDIEPYSDEEKDPAIRVQELRDIWHQDILPIFPFLMQLGIRPNIEKYLRLIADYGDLSELRDVLGFMPDHLFQNTYQSRLSSGQPEVGGRPGIAPTNAGVSSLRPPAPSNTTREYVRRSEANPSQAGFRGSNIAELIKEGMRSSAQSTSR